MKYKVVTESAVMEYLSGGWKLYSAPIYSEGSFYQAMTFKEKKEKTVVDNSLFESFWDKYPRKIGKSKAEKCFNSMTKTEKEKSLNAVVNYEFSKEKKYIPHASTWLNGKRYNDTTEDQFIQPLSMDEKEKKAYTELWMGNEYPTREELDKLLTQYE